MQNNLCEYCKYHNDPDNRFFCQECSEGDEFVISPVYAMGPDVLAMLIKTKGTIEAYQKDHIKTRLVVILGLINNLLDTLNP